MIDIKEVVALLPSEATAGALLFSTNAGSKSALLRFDRADGTKMLLQISNDPTPGYSIKKASLVNIRYFKLGGNAELLVDLTSILDATEGSAPGLAFRTLDGRFGIVADVEFTHVHVCIDGSIAEPSSEETTTYYAKWRLTPPGELSQLRSVSSGTAKPAASPNRAPPSSSAWG